MLREDQKKWLSHLSDTNIVKVIPYDPNAKVRFQNFKTELQHVLGKDVTIVHRGASSLGISGQGELDIYVPVPPSMFDTALEQLTIAFGEPGSVSAINRARFNIKREGGKIEIHLVNQDAQVWKENTIFFNYLQTHPDALSKYEQLKEHASGASTREYYRRKIEFINEILTQALSKRS
ncbi:MAG TPA: GrpB family protein [Patescibacteria group bacterium]|nr:GrpB family protein [Patescibacteria group bacterium]